MHALICAYIFLTWQIGRFGMISQDIKLEMVTFNLLQSWYNVCVYVCVYNCVVWYNINIIVYSNVFSFSTDYPQKLNCEIERVRFTNQILNSL